MLQQKNSYNNSINNRSRRNSENNGTKHARKNSIHSGNLHESSPNKIFNVKNEKNYDSQNTTLLREEFPNWDGQADDIKPFGKVLNVNTKS
jgi:hypothetical protein